MPVQSIRVIPANLSPKTCRTVPNYIVSPTHKHNGYYCTAVLVYVIQTNILFVFFFFCSIRILRIVWWFNYRATGPWVRIVCATTVTERWPEGLIVDHVSPSKPACSAKFERSTVERGEVKFISDIGSLKISKTMW
jgi:hypothetical protein